MAQAAPVAIITHEASQPILPPRTTARSIPVQRATASIWRSWPMLVIVLAVIAIVAATVIMVLPQGKKHDSGKMSAPPAPERMETNPLPDKSSQNDPWGAPGADPRAPTAPLPPRGGPQPPDPDDTDIWGGGAGGGLGGFGQGGGAFMITVLDRACKKLKACPDTDQSSLKIICDQVEMMPKPPVPSSSSCPTARKCLDAIENLSCDSAAQASPHSVFTMFDACMDASRC